MESFLLNTIIAAFLISSLGYLIYRMGRVVKTFSSNGSAGCHDLQEDEQCDHCVLAPENRGVAATMQKTL